ncbi:OmpA family protein [Moraxella oculi]|uniref:OmpA family protein n=1 Tax=Moraxella oculi TaxID=2940516 RepID=UPI0024B3A7F1|nr:OmpA family protein [Moraxella sp. Tifton1]
MPKFNPFVTTASAVASAMLLFFSTHAVATIPNAVSWSKSAQIDSNPLNPKLSERTASIILVRPKTDKQSNPDDSLNIAVNGRFLTSIQDNHYAQAIVCSGDVALSLVPTAVKINDLMHQVVNIKVEPGQTKVLVADVNDRNIMLASLEDDKVANAFNGIYRQNHQISRVQAENCPPPPPKPEPVLPPPPAPVPQPVSEYYVEVRPNVKLNILFDTNKSDIKKEYQGEIAKAADFLSQYADAKVIVEGHTDSRGSDAYNQALSERRAAAVRLELIKNYGVNPARISAQGFGEIRPVATNDTVEGRAQNRRVMVVIPNEQ